MHITISQFVHTLKTRLEKAGFKTFCFSAVLLYKRIHSVRSNIIQTPHCDAILFKLQKIGRTERKMFAVFVEVVKYNNTSLKLIVCSLMKVSFAQRDWNNILVRCRTRFSNKFFLFKKNCILLGAVDGWQILIILLKNHLQWTIESSTMKTGKYWEN